MFETQDDASGVHPSERVREEKERERERHEREREEADLQERWSLDASMLGRVDV